MKRSLRFLAPVVVIVLSVLIARTLITTGPKAERRVPPRVVPAVEVLVAQPGTYQVQIETRGTVSPRTESTLIPEVSGRVIDVATNFREGGFFERGDLLLRIDPRDYENRVTVAGAELARAEVDLEEEQARARLAVEDWNRMGVAGSPSDLVLRKPQMARAQAAVAAARANLQQARINLERTRIVAPYVGRVLDKSVDIGQYVAPGTVLASVYAVDYVEIRLPLTGEQLAFIRLPEAYRGESTTPVAQPPVVVRARIGQREYQWRGEIVRTEGAIDTRSRQLFVVAQVDDPYARREDIPPLKVGQFVEALIPGQRLEGVFVLPRSVLRANDEVLLVDDENRLRRQPVSVIWRDDSDVVVDSGLSAGARVSLTNLPYGASGTPVRVNDTAPSTSQVAEDRGEAGPDAGGSVRQTP